METESDPESEVSGSRRVPWGGDGRCIQFNLATKEARVDPAFYKRHECVWKPVPEGTWDAKALLCLGVAMRFFRQWSSGRLVMVVEDPFRWTTFRQLEMPSPIFTIFLVDSNSYQNVVSQFLENLNTWKVLSTSKGGVGWEVLDVPRWKPLNSNTSSN